MRKATLFVSPFYLGNRIFNGDDPVANRDNCLHPFILLREAFAAQGVELATQDINPVDEAEFVIYNDMPKELPPLSQRDKSAVILFESELIRPDNWNRKNWDHFRWIFTWHDGLVDGKRFFKLNFSQNIPDSIAAAPFAERKLCAMIAGHKRVRHPLELYGEREKAIRWFERNHPEDFDLYGIGWDKPAFASRLVARAMNRLPLLARPFFRPFPSWRGKVISKNDTLSRYRFAICYENARDIPGYITEKLFDCLFAGCVPVYWGAQDIGRVVPPACFIDRREFDSYEALYRFMKAMNEREFQDRVQAISRYIVGNRIKDFSAEEFSRTIVDIIDNTN